MAGTAAIRSGRVVRPALVSAAWPGARLPPSSTSVGGTAVPASLSARLEPVSFARQVAQVRAAAGAGQGGPAAVVPGGGGGPVEEGDGVDRPGVGRAVGDARAGADVGEEVGPVDQLHREEPAVAVGDQLPEADEVGVDHVGQDAELLLEPVEGRGVEVADRLQGDRLVALAVIRLVDDPHAADAHAACGS